MIILNPLNWTHCSWVETCIKALRAIGTGDLFIFKGNSVDQIEKVTLKKRGLEALTPEQVALRSNPSRDKDVDDFSVTELDDEEQLQAVLSSRMLNETTLPRRKKMTAKKFLTSKIISTSKHFFDVEKIFQRQTFFRR